MEFDLEGPTYYEGKQFVSDCNGPITRNDNARDLCERFIPNGARLFDVVSRYDDVQAHILHRESYSTGDTLKLILPFLKAFGATDTSIFEESKRCLRVSPGAGRTMRFLNDLMPSFIVSASYEHHLMAVCDEIGFPFTNVYCTPVRMDVIEADPWETDLLTKVAAEVAAMTPATIPHEATSILDFDEGDRESIERLDVLFWDEMTDLESYDFILEVEPIGGTEKAYSLMDVRRKTGIDLDDTMYVGDEITDIQAMQLISESGGLAVAFNGDRYGLEHADVAVVSPDTVVTSVIADVFYKGGRDAAMALVDCWGPEGARGLVDEYLIKEMGSVFGDEWPIVTRITDENVDGLVAASEAFRRENYLRSTK